jgi:hypothetical protein
MKEFPITRNAFKTVEELEMNNAGYIETIEKLMKEDSLDVVKMRF